MTRPNPRTRLGKKQQIGVEEAVGVLQEAEEEVVSEGEEGGEEEVSDLVMFKIWERHPVCLRWIKINVRTNQSSLGAEFLSFFSS